MLSLKRLKQYYLVKRMLWESKRHIGVNELKDRAAPVCPDRIAILPGDVWTLTGSKGDEAMLVAVAQYAKSINPKVVVGVVTASNVADQAAESLGFKSIRALSYGKIRESCGNLVSFKPDALFVVGADVLDGYYDPVTATQMLLIADGVARSGVAVSVLGFSFNSSPDHLLSDVYGRICDGVALNIRDEISLHRFREFTRRPARLVADVAFCLQPEVRRPEVQAGLTWVKKRQSNGGVVLAFNIHPMLIRRAEDADVSWLVSSSIEALSHWLTNRNNNVLLISHDLRGLDGDDRCLSKIFEKIRESYPEQVLYSNAQLSAAEIKGLVGSVDAVVSGRMHLAIAALGMARPVAALTYQDKFQGLFSHFEIPDRFLLDPLKLQDPTELIRLIDDLMGTMDRLGEVVGLRLPYVINKSRENMECLVGKG